MSLIPEGADADAAVNALSAAGAAFELRTISIAGSPCRIFPNGPQTLADIYRVIGAYDARTLCVHPAARLTYAEVRGQAAALANHLSNDFGVARGARVAIAMHNRPEWLVSFIAITALGATAVLVNSRGTAAEIGAALGEADVTVVIADAERAQAIANAGRVLPLLVADTAPFAAAVAGWRDAVLAPVDTGSEDAAVVMFTSGTTGGSKAVLLSQRAVLTGLMNIQYSMAVVGARIAARHGGAGLAALAGRQPSALLAVPLFHTSGCYSVFLSNLLRGGKVVMLPKWNAVQALDLIEREQVMAFSGAPTMLWDVLRADRSGRDLSSLLSVGVGGQALQPQLLREIVAAFPQAVLGGGYGMTESSGSVCLIAGAELLQRPTSSGRVLATADIKLVDDADVEVGPGEVGEICLRGAMLMDGYCNRPDDTAAVLRDGWLHTGDLGRIDAEDYLHVIDRKKDIVISGGENIACTEVEGAVMEHPAVAEAAAFGVADERLGEILVVAAVLAPGHTLDAQALKDHVAERLAIYKVPRAVLECAELPRNALGKVNRNVLRRDFLARQGD